MSKLKSHEAVIREVVISEAAVIHEAVIGKAVIAGKHANCLIK